MEDVRIGQGQKRVAPEEVRADPRVVESYLGGDIRAIERSGDVTAPMVFDMCAALTRSGKVCSRRAVASGLCAQHFSVPIRT